LNMLQHVAKNVVKNVISTFDPDRYPARDLCLFGRWYHKRTFSAKSRIRHVGVYLNTFRVYRLRIPVVALRCTIAAKGAGGSCNIGRRDCWRLLDLLLVEHFTGGMDYVPSENIVLLDKGERCFLLIKTPTNIIPCRWRIIWRRHGDSEPHHPCFGKCNEPRMCFTRMDKIELRHMLGQPVIDALNELWKFGIQRKLCIEEIMKRIILTDGTNVAKPES